MGKKRKIFISAVSGELGTYRQAVAQWLPACNCEAVEQNTFELTDALIIDKLRAKIAQCDAMICLIGTQYGSAPSQSSANYKGHSFTQLEYKFAQEMKIPTYRMLTHEAEDGGGGSAAFTPRDCENSEGKQLRTRQTTFREAVILDHDWQSFHSVDNLIRLLSTLQFPWSPGVALCMEESQERSISTSELREMFAEVFTAANEDGEKELPDYAERYLAKDWEQSERAAIRATSDSSNNGTSGHQQRARACWIAGLSA